MKTKIYLSSAIALIFSACTTGSYITSGYGDDIYFNPSEIPPPVVAEEIPQRAAEPGTKSPDRLIISEITDNNEGSKTMNNYIYDGKDASGYANAQVYNMDQMQPEGSDTTIYYDDNDIKYVINNYYDGSDVDFTSRIRMFHRPYFYDPFYWHDWYWNDWYWDSWCYPYSSFYGGMGWNNWGWGYSPWYSGYYGGWYGSYYGSWYGPYDYYGMGGWGYPYYAGGGNYYNHYWGNGDKHRDNVRYGRNSDFSNYSAGRSSGTRGTGSNLKDAQSRSLSGDPVINGKRSVNGTENSIRSVRQGSQISSGGRTITEMRRSNIDAVNSRNRTGENFIIRSSRQASPSLNNENGRQRTVSGNDIQSRSTAERRSSGSQNQYTRPANIQGRSSNGYSPSYNQQRSSNRNTYNVQEYSRPSGSVDSQSGQMKSAERSTTIYSRPSGSSGVDRSYRSGSTYSRSSSSGINSERTYSQPSGNSRSNYDSYSSPSRSSGSSYSAPSQSSGSYNSGGGYSGGSSNSGGSSGGGGSSSGGRSGSGGRR